MKQASQAIGAALDVLRAEEQRLTAELTTLKQTEKSLLAGLQRVQAGIQALGSDSVRGQASGHQKPGLSDAEVFDVVAEAVRESGAMGQEKLKASLLQHAKAKGAVGTGLHLALKRVLKDARFVINGQGMVSLASSAMT